MSATKAEVDAIIARGWQDGPKGKEGPHTTPSFTMALVICFVITTYPRYVRLLLWPLTYALRVYATICWHRWGL